MFLCFLVADVFFCPFDAVETLAVKRSHEWTMRWRGSGLGDKTVNTLLVCTSASSYRTVVEADKAFGSITEKSKTFLSHFPVGSLVTVSTKVSGVSQ